ncbi:CD83 antigen [Puma concolor]|uniref:CD83 antigen n=1 Tax=Puma concolor TaxID=9696 RepID=A0A6P6HAY8_PUMCO|nr:CD83 antigen [Puma concolor]
MALGVSAGPVSRCPAIARPGSCLRAAAAQAVREKSRSLAGAPCGGGDGAGLVRERWWLRRQVSLQPVRPSFRRVRERPGPSRPALTGDGEERIEMPPEGLWYHQQKDGSLEASGERLYSLKIENTTSVDSGTYRCILEEPEGRRNQSGTVTLKVTGCPKERKEDTFQKYRAEIVLLLALVVFYLTLIIFTCKFAQQQSIFPDFSKPGTQRAFLPVVSPNKHLEPATLHKTELV